MRRVLLKTFPGVQPLSLPEKIEIQSMGDPKDRNLPKIELKEKMLLLFGKSETLDSDTWEEH